MTVLYLVAALLFTAMLMLEVFEEGRGLLASVGAGALLLAFLAVVAVASQEHERLVCPDCGAQPIWTRPPRTPWEPDQQAFCLQCAWERGDLVTKTPAP